MSTRVLVTPAAGMLLRNPADPTRRIAPEGEIMIDSIALRRLERDGDVTIAPEPVAAPATKKKDA